MSEESGTSAAIARRVRDFNRFWALRMGLIRSRLYGTSFTLAETRVLTEIGRRTEIALADIRTQLGLEPSVMSRMIQRFEDQSLVSVTPAPSDGRRKVLTLTEKGLQTVHQIDSKVLDEVAQILKPLTAADQSFLVELLEGAESLLSGSSDAAPIQIRGVGPGDLGWVVYRHGAVYADEYSWNREYEAGIARIVADYVSSSDGRLESAWIAEIAGQRVGSCFCTQSSDGAAQIEGLFIEPRFRGRGVVIRLLEEAIRFARGAGYHTLVFVTIDRWQRGEEVAERFGFRPIDDVVSASLPPGVIQQAWELDLLNLRAN